MRNVSLWAAICLLFVTSSVRANEGMWLPFLLKQLNESDMKALGMKMSAEDIYSVNKGSLKDAIVHFGGFCTGEIISNQGLILTNHHCGFDAIQTHTTLQNNYLEDGFWAKNLAAEKPNEGLFVTFLERMEDVTKEVFAGVTAEMDAKTRQSTIDKNIDAYLKGMKKGQFENAVIKPFFQGNQYILIVSVDYPDVRLVGAPPSSIGKFGADTDNWVWPRHTGDFSLFRVYTDKNGQPASYAPDNVPMKPKHHLPVSLDGVQPNDFTLVFGYPGRTDEYLPSSGVTLVKDVMDPLRIAMRDRSLKIMDSYMRKDPQIKIQYASKYASIANGWKKWIGEIQGLNKSNAVAKKQAYEADFIKRSSGNKDFSGNLSLLDKFHKVYADITPLTRVREMYYEMFRNVELYQIASTANRLVNAYEKNGEKGYADMLMKSQGGMAETYKDYRAEVDEAVFASLTTYMFENLEPQYKVGYFAEQLSNRANTPNLVARDIYKNSILVSATKMEAVLALQPAEAVAALKNDPAMLFINSMGDMYKEKVGEDYNRLSEQIDDLKQKYMAAQLAVFSDKKFFPDANSTMRVAYGKVDGYQPKDAVTYQHQTYLDGVIEKFVPGDYEFDVPSKLLDLQKKKDFGQYGENGKMPVCFVGSNHTTGGNSGSPAIDAYGNLIGLNFDRAWEGTMSDINYDPNICRNIMVDIRYVLFIVDKFAGAGHLVNEMTLVHPKATTTPVPGPSSTSPSTGKVKTAKKAKDTKKSMLRPVEE